MSKKKNCLSPKRHTSSFLKALGSDPKSDPIKYPILLKPLPNLRLRDRFCVFYIYKIPKLPSREKTHIPPYKSHARSQFPGAIVPYSSSTPLVVNIIPIPFFPIHNLVFFWIFFLFLHPILSFCFFFSTIL